MINKPNLNEKVFVLYCGKVYFSCCYDQQLQGHWKMQIAGGLWGTCMFEGEPQRHKTAVHVPMDGLIS